MSGVSLPVVTLLSGVSVPAVVFESVELSAAGVSVEVFTSVSEGEQPKVRVKTAIAAKPRRIRESCFTGRGLRWKEIDRNVSIETIECVQGAGGHQQNGPAACMDSMLHHLDSIKNRPTVESVFGRMKVGMTEITPTLGTTGPKPWRTIRNKLDNSDPKHRFRASDAPENRDPWLTRHE